MARNGSPQDFGNDRDEEVLFEPLDLDPMAFEEFDARQDAPSLPIIFLSAASGIAAGIVALYLTYTVFTWRIEWSVAATVFCLCAALGITGAALSAVTRSRAAMGNIAFSCGLIVVTLFFFALCTLAGAFAATLILTL